VAAPDPIYPTFEEMMRGFSAKLIHQLEIFLVGDEVLEDLLIEHFSNDVPATPELIEFIEKTHSFFHDHLRRETKNYCGKCVEPSENILKYLVEHRHTPPLKTNPL
jgi:hypothetical protein